MTITATITQTTITPTVTGGSTVSAAVTSSPITVTADGHAALTIGTANGLSLTGQTLSLGLASGAAAGALSAADWTTFNAKAGLALANIFTLNQKINTISTTALLVEQDGVHDNTLVVDTTNGGVGIGMAPTVDALDITGNVGLHVAGNFIGFPGVPGQSLIPWDANLDMVINSLNDLYFNIDSAAGGGVREIVFAKGRTGSSSGTPLIKIGSNGSVGIYETNAFFGYPGSTTQGFSPFDASFNFLFNSIGNHFFIMDADNNSTTSRIVFAKDADNAAGATAVMTLHESGRLVLTGPIEPAWMADADAPLSAIYYSTNAGKLVYKDVAGVVNNLY